jgi:hypothetical protein
MWDKKIKYSRGFCFKNNNNLNWVPIQNILDLRLPQTLLHPVQKPQGESQSTVRRGPSKCPQ